jgi:RNA polymerase sigma-70 factor, ECF subfamily
VCARATDDSVTSLDSAADGLLAERAADGDERAFAVLVRRHAPFLIAFATRLIGSRAEADDCVQDALIVAWQRMDSLQEPARVRAWLATIVSRKATDRLRGRRDLVDIDEQEQADPAADPADRAETSIRLDALSRAVERLPDDLRRTWVLRELVGHSYEEIAEVMEESTSTVRGRLARARRQLAQELEGWR